MIQLGRSLDSDLRANSPTRGASTTPWYSITHVGAHQSPDLDWHGLHAGGSVAPYRTVGPEDTNHEEDTRACVDLLKSRIKKMVRIRPAG
jgi:hypothetical protein